MFGRSLLSAWMPIQLAMQGTRGALPVVNLGYVQQQATTYNHFNDVYTFSNIRYAQSPTDALRWRPPQPPFPETGIQDGKRDRICYQSEPYWQMELLGPWLDAVATNQTEQFYARFPDEPSPSISGNSTTDFPPLLPSETEDCLFLDVHVPRKAFEKRSTRRAPVMVWIHGGGLVLGSKIADGNFSALAAQSLVGGRDPVIVVSINYRLGAFGFLGGPGLRNESGVSNVGLLDQAFALDWVKRHIGAFGGCSTDITVAGESAGGASIIHQIVSRGGKGPAPVFQKAIIQSGGWNPTRTTHHLEDIYRLFLSALRVSNLEDARKQSSKDIRDAGFLITYTSKWGGLGFGVEADGVLIPKPAPLLLASGNFHHNVSIMTGQNAAEGVIFSSPWTRNFNETEHFLALALPDTPSSEIHHINHQVYSPPDGRSVVSFVDRAQELVAEAGILCQSAFLAHAFSLESYNYLFNVTPAWHGDDLSYTFYDGTDPTVNVNVARAMQQHFLSFIKSGNPNTDVDKTTITWEQYGTTSFTLSFGGMRNQSVSQPTINPGENSRCTSWWGNEFYSWV